MRNDRELIALVKSRNLEAISDQLRRPLATILRRAARLGLAIKLTAKAK
jgi:hypothetical protein